MENFDEPLAPTTPWTADPLTVMAVHAHPDDESSSTGGVLARYAAEGFRTVVVTCTNGELGDGPGHVKPDEPGHDPDAVARTRLAELERACEVLGVGHLELLGYHDSGMPDWRHRHLEQVFCNVPLDVGAARIVDVFEKYRPSVVITYDDNGGYSHPDHVHAHRITMAALEQTPIAAKLYLIARRRRDWDRLREHMLALGVEMPPRPVPDADAEERSRLLEERITTSVDITAFAVQKRAALAAHASQLDESWLLRIGESAFHEVFGSETFIRERDVTGAPLPETDLLAGLRIE